FAVWTGLRALGVGANLQHYNPIINKIVQNMFDVPKSWVLVAQMPFGGIANAPGAKPDEDVMQRIKFAK
ncbi:MAG: nitroreductase, partial [Alphaproteobacteria bacterium]|nr:nitroreductase [Alphaproteobacteria bacterium]